jgi:hypothetical protein
LRLVHFNFARPVPFTIALSGTAIDDFGNEVWMVADKQWYAASRFTDDNHFDLSLGFGDEQYPAKRSNVCT